MAAVVGLALFQPWKLVVDETVDEAAPPGVADAAAPAGALVARGNPAGRHPVAGSGPDHRRPGVRPAGDGPLPLARAPHHRHGAGGRAAGRPAGAVIEDLDTSNGPDLKLWLTDAPVRPGWDGWFADDGRHVDLGRPKGNRGSQNYELPDSVDLRRLTGLSIWCDRFNVSFGAAELRVA